MSDLTAPSVDTLDLSIEGRLGRLTLDQPERLNPIGSQALHELAVAAAWFETVGASVVVVSGAGRAFSSGFDLRELRAPSGRSMSTPELGAEMAEAIGGMSAVTVASIGGPCVGGGFVLAMCCDLRIASSEAWFSLPEVELGIPLAWSGVPRLVREIGPARTIELVLSGRRLPAAEAHAWGVLNQVVAADELDATVDAMASLLLSRRPEVLDVTKRQVQEAADSLIATDGSWAGTGHLVAALEALASDGPGA